MSDEHDFRRATELGQLLVAKGPVAVGASYDAPARRIAIRLASGLELRVVPEDVEGLENASDAQLAAVEVEPPGLTLRWEALDASLFLPYLVADKLGEDVFVRLILGERRNQRRAARRLGRLGGRIRRRA